MFHHILPASFSVSASARPTKLRKTTNKTFGITQKVSAEGAFLYLGKGFSKKKFTFVALSHTYTKMLPIAFVTQ